jgi:hypothetical protein
MIFPPEDIAIYPQYRQFWLISPLVIAPENGLGPVDSRIGLI